MKQITDPDRCTGCSACRLLCPQKCIDMGYDDEGFYIPFIDEALCMECQACANRCPANMCLSLSECTPIKVLAARLKDDIFLNNSSSGGVFVGMAQHVLGTSGNAVFGCVFDDDIIARHIYVTEIGDIAPMQGSKYVQSDVGNTYLQAKEILENGSKVFYTGCPCQIAGLYAFLGEDYENLITADLICHGVPSPLLFKRYINKLELQLGEKVTDFKFRSKQKFGWSLTAKAETRTKTKIIISNSDPYYSSFLQGFTYRKACYTCKYASGNRVADITLGDFWGVEGYHPQFYDARGVSVVLINSDKGNVFFEQLHGKFEILESTFDIATMKNRNLLYPSSKPEIRKFAYDNINNEEIDLFGNACYNIGIKNHVKAFAKRITPPFLLHKYKVIKHKY